MQLHADNPVNQHLTALKVLEYQKSRTQLRKPSAVAEVLESALDLERPAYYDNFITSELLELLHDVSGRTRNMGKYAQNVCCILRRGCDDLLHEYRADWGWDAYEMFAITAFNVAYDGIVLRDEVCFQHGVHLLTTVCQTATTHLEDGAADIRSSHWKTLTQTAAKKLSPDMCAFLKIMRSWSREKYSQAGRFQVQDHVFQSLGIHWM